MTLKEKAFSVVTEDRVQSDYPFRRLNMGGLLRCAVFVSKGPEVRKAIYDKRKSSTEC